MTLVVHSNVLFQQRGSVVALPPRRRRLSTIMARHASGRRAIPLVFRKGQDWSRASALEIDRAARLRSQYASTLVGPHDTVILYEPPKGGRVGLAIGLTLAAIALTAIAGPAGTAISGALFAGSTAAAFAIQTGITIGAMALSYAASRSAASAKKSAKGGDTYASLSGGGNVARVGDRRPLSYGKHWHTPTLSQRDTIAQFPTATTVYKRLTLGIGKFDVHRIRIGDSLFWTKEGGVQPPFNSAPFFGNESFVEILYEQVSNIHPGDFITSSQVNGQEMPRPSNNPSISPWFRLTPQGISVDEALMNYTFGPLGYKTSKGELKATFGSIWFEFQRLDATGAPYGPIITPDGGQPVIFALKNTPTPQCVNLKLPQSTEWQVRARNPNGENSAIDLQNSVSWDSMTGVTRSPRIRNGTTEICIRISGIKGLPISGVGDVGVEATRIIPVYDGNAWVETPTRKAVWAVADLIRSQHGAAQPLGVDLAKFAALAARTDIFDTFDGVLPSVSSLWEAANEILAPMRAELVKTGGVFSIVRDESAEEAGGRRFITRRQIVRDSGSQDFSYTTTESTKGDIIVEFDREGDPRRPDEARQTLFAQTRTPKRFRMNGVRDGAHAVALANWLGARSLYRGDSRKVSVEWDGRLIYPGAHITADLWYVDGKAVVGVQSASGNNLVLDAKPDIPGGDTYVSIRTRKGREWGVLRATYDGLTGLSLNGSDVAATVGQTGLSLESVLARETQDPTTIMLGPLTEVQETYVARSAIPADQDRVEIDMVYDDARVWLALAEPVIAPQPPVSDVPAVILRPIVPYVRAKCETIETTIELIWGIGTAVGAALYDVDLSYDAGATWEQIQVQLATQSGRYPIHQSTDPVRVRARAYGTTGLPGDYQVAVFSTKKPMVDAGQTNIIGIALDNLNQETRNLLEGTGPGSIGEAKANADAAQDRADDAFDRADTAAKNAGAGLKAQDDFRLALSADPADRTRGAVAERSLRDDLDNALAIIVDLQSRVYDLGGRLVEMGAGVGPDGVYRIAGQTVLEGRANRVDLSLDSLSARITAVANTVVDGDFDGLIDQLTQVSFDLDAVEAALTLKVDTTTFTPLVTTVQQLGITVSGQQQQIDLKAAKQVVDDLSATLGSAIIQINAQGSILSSVSAANFALDNEMRDATFEDIIARLLELKGTAAQALSNATQTISARVTETGAALAESTRTLLAFQGSTAAQFSEVIQSIATGDAASTTATAALDAFVKNPTTGLPATLARLVVEEQTRATQDLAESTARSTLSAQVNNPTSGLPATLARIITEESTRAAADHAEAVARIAIGTQVEDPLTGLAATRSRIITEETTRNSADSALAGRATTIESAVNHPTTGLGPTLARLITEEQTRSTNDSAQSTRSAALEATVNHPTTGVSPTFARLVTEEGVRATADTALSNRTTVLEGSVNAPGTGLSATYGRIVSEESVRANADTVLTTNLQTLSSEVRNPTTGLAYTLARLLTEETTRANADSAEAALRTALESVVKDPSTGLPATLARIITEEQTRAAADTAESNARAALDAVVKDPSSGLPATLARLITEESARASAVSAVGSRTTTIEAKLDNPTSGLAAAHAAIYTADQARIAGDSAIVTTLNQVGAKADGVSAFGRRSTNVTLSGPDNSTVTIEDRISKTVGGQTYSGGRYTVLNENNEVIIVDDVDKYYVGKLVNGQLVRVKFLEVDASTGFVTVPNLKVTGAMVAKNAISSADYVGKGGDTVLISGAGSISRGNYGEVFFSLLFDYELLLSVRPYAQIYAQGGGQVTGTIFCSILLDDNSVLAEVQIGQQVNGTGNVSGGREPFDTLVPANTRVRVMFRFQYNSPSNLGGLYIRNPLLAYTAVRRTAPT